MITPLEGLRVLQERPYPYQSLTKRFYNLFTRDSYRSETALESDLRELLERVSNCRSRSQLTTLLGNPDYTIDGSLFGTQTPDGTTESPDIVECYSRSRLTVELWFRAGRHEQTIGYIVPKRM